MIHRLIFKILSILVIASLLQSCSEEFNEIPSESNNQKTRKMGKALLEISYEITTSTNYSVEPIALSDLDLSAINPSNEKQKITLELLDDGQINMTIVNLDFKQKIKNPHRILPDTSPEIVRTVIVGNTASFYDRAGNLLGTETAPIPNHMELVHKINELGRNISQDDINETIATMQGNRFIANLQDFIDNAAANNIQISERGNGIITARMPLSNVDSRMTEEAVLLIDKNKNRLLGTRIYSADNQLLQSSLYGYNTGKVKSLSGIKTEELFILPSGNTTTMITLSKIENLKFNLNI